MKPKHLYGVVAAWCVVFFVLVTGMCAQETPVPRHVGVTQDWSQRQIVFSRDALARHPELLDQEPRIRQQAMQRWQAPNLAAFPDVDPLPNPQEKSGPNRDWNIATLGSRLHTNMFPAKYSFNPGAAPDCTNDYVVFALPIAGVDGGQANLVAFNELYSGASPAGMCGSAPNVYFAYNVTTLAGGKIVTSPVLSLDGTQIAFVETVPGTPGSSIFHVLTWTGGQGAIGAAVTPTPAQMTSLTLTSAATSTTSSPWVDYGSHTAYMGDDIGNVYQVTSVFNGTPALSGGNWPILVSSNYHLTPPVLDSSRGLLMVGSGNGDLYQISTASGLVTGTLVVGRAGGTSSGIVAPPIVDVTNGTTFVVSANGGSSAVLVEADTTTNLPLATAPIGEGASTGTKLRLFQPAFNNAYYNNPANGVVSLCGTGGSDTTPWQYKFGFTVRTMNTTPSFSTQLSTDPTDRCTGWTEFFNPNVAPPGGTDFFFFGLTGDCETVLLGTTTTGCVVAIGTHGLSTNFTTADVDGGPSGIVVDNYSVDAQASSIYLTSLTANTAFKFTQSGLD